MIRKSLLVFLEGNSSPRGDGSYSGCKTTINFSETVYNAKRIVLSDFFVTGSNQPRNPCTHLVLDLGHPSLHSPTISNRSALTDKHVIFPDQQTTLKIFTAGTTEFCHPHYNRELFFLNPGANLNNLPVNLYSPEGVRLDSAILKLDIYHESVNYRDVSHEKTPSNVFNDSFV